MAQNGPVIYFSISLSMYGCMYVCMHISIYIYIYTHIYNIYTYHKDICILGHFLFFHGPASSYSRASPSHQLVNPTYTQITEAFIQHKWRNLLSIFSIAGRNLTGHMLQLKLQNYNCAATLLFFKWNLMFASSFHPAWQLKLIPSIQSIQGHTGDLSPPFWLSLSVLQSLPFISP